MSISIKILLGCMLVFTFASCKNDNGPFAQEFVSYDIVKLESINTVATVFELYKPDSDELITYTDDRGAVLDTSKVALGSRILLGYITENLPYVSGKIRATGYNTIFNDSLRLDNATNLSATKSTDEGIYIYSIWRMGTYLNIHGKVTYSEQGATLLLSMGHEALSAQQPIPLLTLNYIMDEPAPNFERDFYASFDISRLWNQSWCEGFRVTVNNTNLNKNIFEFLK